MPPISHLVVDVRAASRKLQSVAVAMRISEAVATAAVQTYTLAVEHKFTKGRKSTLVGGVCLYVVCRQQTTQNRFMSIDFADIPPCFPRTASAG